MKEIKKWQINVSIGFLIASIVITFIDMFLGIISTEDFFFGLGMIIGSLVSIYFTIVIPLLVLLEYKKARSKK